MIKIGLTGGMGSGKTTIAKIFSLLNIPIYIADERSKKLVDESVIIKDKLKNLFGQDIITDNKVDKRKLAEIIFKDSDSLLKVNAIIHPEVRNDYFEWCKLHSDSDYTVLETAILFDSNFSSFVDYTINVVSPQEERIKRCINRDNVSRKAILERMNNQMSDYERNKRADFIIYNDEQHSLIEQVKCILIVIQNEKI